MTYYIKGGSRYNAANPKVWVGLFLGGFPDADYLLTDWVNLDDKGHETAQDPFYRLGGSAGGAKEFELGLWNDFRIKFETTGITYWDGDSWNDLLTGGGGKDNLYELDDVVITGTPAEDEVLAYDNVSSKWINQTAGEAGLSLSGHGHGQLHDESHSLASHSSEAHNELTGYNDETDVKHLTDAQLGALHAIYTLESHNNTYHSTNYHTESDGTGVVTVHSDVTSVGSGAIITTNERNDLHAVLTNLTQLTTRNHNDLLNINAGDAYEHITQTQKDALHAIYTLEVHDNDEHNPDFCVDDDARLSDARTPTSHMHDGDTLQIDGINSNKTVTPFKFESDTFIDFYANGDPDQYIRFQCVANTLLIQFQAVGGYIQNVIDPVNDQDAATKKYHDDNKYSLEQHNNTYHSTNYHSESDGTGVVTVHSGITSAGSGIIISIAERNALHTIYSLEQHNNDYHSTNYHPAFTENEGFNNLYGITSNTVCVGNDARLSDARSPTAHALQTHIVPLDVDLAMNANKITGLANGTVGTDAMAFGQKYSLEQHNNTYHSTNYHTESDGTGAVTVHSGITDAGSGIIISTGERNALHPKQHAMDAIGEHTRTDITTLNASTSFHGFLKKLDNSSSNFMNGQGNWAVPPGAGDSKETSLQYVEDTGLVLSPSKVITSADADGLNFTFGRAGISGISDVAYFGHRDHVNASNYMIKQLADGNTWINAPTGKTVVITLNNTSTIATFNSTGISMTTGKNIDLNGGHVIIDATPPITGMATGTVLEIDTTGCSNFQVVYCDLANSVQPADANAIATCKVIGMVIAAGKVLMDGIVRNDSWTLTPGAIYYASTTPGAITTTKPSGNTDVVIAIGIAVGIDQLLVRPGYAWVEVVV